MPEYYLIDDGMRMPRWCELGHGENGSFWIDFKGRRTAYGEARPIAVVEAQNPSALLKRRPPEIAVLERERALRLLLDPWSDQGWLSPNGRFYGCAFFAHDDLVHALLGKHVAELEQTGWIRVHADCFLSSPVFRRETTARQAETLAALGFQDAQAPGGRRTRYEPDRDQPPPGYAYRPTSAEAAPPTQSPVPKAADKPCEEEAFGPMIRRLVDSDLLAPLFSQERSLIADVGPGRWRWMFEFDDVHFGSEETPADLAAAAGLYVYAVAFDQLEVSAWPHEGVHVSDAARQFLASLPGAEPRPRP